MTSTPAPTTSQTITTAPEEEPAQSSTQAVKLKKPKGKAVKWDNSAVDNEHMNKKSSKVCCIYHKPKEFGESDSEDEDCLHSKNAYDRG